MLGYEDIAENTRNVKRQITNLFDRVLSPRKVIFDDVHNLIGETYEVLFGLSYDGATPDVIYDIECLKRCVREAFIDVDDDEANPDLRVFVERLQKSLDRGISIYGRAVDLQFTYAPEKEDAPHV